MPSSTTSRSRSVRCARSWRAEVARVAGLAVPVAAATLAGCTSPPEYRRLAEDRFRVSYLGGADLCALRYAAELTLAAGYSHFYASHGVGPGVYATHFPGPATTTTIVKGGEVKTVSCAPGLPMCGGTTVYSETPASYDIQLLEEAPDPAEARRIVRRLGVRPQTFFVYEASALRDSLDADRSLECSPELPIALEPPPPEPELPIAPGPSRRPARGSRSGPSPCGWRERIPIRSSGPTSNIGWRTS